MLKLNIKLFNLENVDLDKKFNHSSFILYYAGDDLKQSSLLDMHSDCVYSPIIQTFVNTADSQAENTPAVIYSFADNRVLRWKKEDCQMGNGVSIRHFLLYLSWLVTLWQYLIMYMKIHLVKRNSINMGNINMMVAMLLELNYMRA